MRDILVAAGLVGCGLERMDDGHNNDVFRVIGQPLVLRVMSSGRAWEQERHVLTDLAARGMPVPAIIADGTLGNRYWLLLSLVQGRDLGKLLPTSPLSVFSSVGATLARLHGVSFPSYGSVAGGGPGYRTWSDYRVERLAGIVSQAAVIDALGSAALASCREFILDGQPAQPRPCLVHRNFRPANLIIDSASNTVSGVIDFEHSVAGEAAMDFAKVESELLAVRPDARGALYGAYGTARPVPDCLEIRREDLLNCLASIAWAARNDDPQFLERSLHRTKALLTGGLPEVGRPLQA